MYLTDFRLRKTLFSGKFYRKFTQPSHQFYSRIVFTLSFVDRDRRSHSQSSLHSGAMRSLTASEALRAYHHPQVSTSDHRACNSDNNSDRDSRSTSSQSQCASHRDHHLDSSATSKKQPQQPRISYISSNENQMNIHAMTLEYQVSNFKFKKTRENSKILSNFRIHGEQPLQPQEQPHQPLCLTALKWLIHPTFSSLRSLIITVQTSN